VVRPTDKIITVIRDPAEIILSNVNYTITRILQDQERGTEAPDTREWKRELGIDSLPQDVPDDMIAKLLRTMLHNPAIAVPNSICYWLGNSDVPSVIRRLVINNVEITDTRNYAVWLRKRWDIVSATRANESRKFVTRKHIQDDDLRYIERITAADREIYGLLAAQIDASDAASIFGNDITGIESYN
jgi:hypothetical protein